ncbi:MAG: hypothetical protein ACXABY_15135 [Candidatus Thorarchaeota archaeon]
MIEHAKSPSKLRDEALNIKRILQHQLQADHEAMAADYIAQLGARVQAEGPASIPRVWGEAMDDFWGYSQKHQWDMERLNELARNAKSAGDWKRADAIHIAISERNRLAYGRVWDRFDSSIQAINEGVDGLIKQLDDAGKMTPEARQALRGFSRETTSRAKGWRKVWEDFFELRDTEIRAFFEAKKANKIPKRTFEEVEELLGGAYAKAIDNEQGILNQLDEIGSQLVPEEARPLYTSWREAVARARLADREMVLGFRDSIKGLTGAEREAAFKQFLPERLEALEAILKEEKIGIQAMQGDLAAQARYAAAMDEIWLKAAISGETADDVRQLAPWQRMENYLANQRLATEETTNLSIKLRDEVIDVVEYESSILKEIPDATDEITDEISTLLETKDFAPSLGIDIPAMPDFHAVVPEELFKGIGMDQLFFNRTDEAIDDIAGIIMEQGKRKDLKLSNLDPDTQRRVLQFAEQVKGQLADERYNAVKFGEWMRDSALLNYNRRHNYNTWLGVMAPYEFWFTQSAWKWMLHSVDRPAMASTYYKMEKFLRTAFRPERGRPSRLEGNIRVKLPFLPEWMGDDIFIDPLRTMLPFKTFAYPWERAQQQSRNEDYQTERVLQELLNSDEISQEDYDEALMNRQGQVWDRALSLAQQESDDRLNTFDFMSMLTMPHAPAMWAYNAARGKPEEIGPFLPLTRSIRAVTAILGIGENGEGWNIEGGVRRELGLPAFDQWDDYRIERMLASMAASGDITSEEAEMAQMEHSGPAWELAQRRAGKEWGWGALGSVLGVPTKFYPEGEEILREQRDTYERAWADYEALGDYDATIGKFYEENPGYEARLALWKSPEERMKAFMVDEIWNIYNDMPKVHRRELKDQMGELFTDAFLSKDTRNYGAISLDEMAIWLRAMGGEAPGQLAPAQPIPNVKLSDPDFAYRMQVFYDIREDNFRYYDEGGLRDIQKKYFMLEDEAYDDKDAYLLQNPILKQYWEWRRDFMLRNPDLIPYIEDNPEKQPKYENIADLQQAFEQQPRFIPFELQTLLGVPLFNLIQMGEPLPQVAQSRLEQIAGEIGVTPEHLLGQMGSTGAPSNVTRYIKAEDGSFVPESFYNGNVPAGVTRYIKAEDGSFVPESFYE